MPIDSNHRVSHRIPAWISFLTLCLCAGCPPAGIHNNKPPPPPRPTPEVVETIQRNAARIDSAVYANYMTVNAKVRDEKNHSHSYNLEGTLLYRRPRDLIIDLRHSLTERIMGIGSNSDEYWIWIEPEVGNLRWGKHIHAGKPCADSSATVPHQLAFTLGMGLPQTDEGLVGPARRTEDKYDVLTYVRLAGRDSLIDREYWVDRYPPYMVGKLIFRDELGRDAMIATLDHYAVDYLNGPLIPHHIEVRWPGSDSRLKMDASKFKPVPPAQISANSFARPPREKLPSGVKSVIQIDAACETQPNPQPSH